MTSPDKPAIPRDAVLRVARPTDDLDELNLLRSRLRAAQIDVLRIRLGD